MIETEAWVMLAAALIPFVSAFSVAPEGSNRWRVLIAVVLSAVVTGLECVTNAEHVNWASCVQVFFVALVTQHAVYKAAQGALGDKDLNESLGQHGVGRIAIDV